MASEFKISVILFLISVMLGYDMLRAGHTFLPFIAFHRTFNFDHLNLPDRLIDFLIKYSCVNAAFALICASLSIIASIIYFRQNRPGICTILNRCIWSHISTYFIFVGLFTRWVTLYYKDETMIDIAVLFAVMYLISRLLLVVGDVTGYFIEFSHLRYPGYVLGVVLNVMMISEIMGLKFIDTLLD